MAKSQETFNKKEVRNKKEKKRKDKEQKRLDKKDSDKTSNFEDMLMYVDENGNLTSIQPDPTKKRKVSVDDIEISIPKRGEMDVTETIRKGVVSFFNDAKGFGFIKDLETQQSVFFHVNNTKEELKENNIVSFEVEMGPKGATAVNVRKSI
jgi:cold shock CspA family protein